MTETTNTSRACHARKPPAGSGFYTSSSGYVYRKRNVPDAETFCGEAPGLDLSYAEIARRRPDFDWDAWFGQLSQDDLMSGMRACPVCIDAALALKAQRSARKKAHR